MDQRLQSLRKWLPGRLDSALQDIRPASEDASFRRYFRVTTADGTCIVMDAPPDKEDVAPFIIVARRLRDLGLNVPRILDSDAEAGFVLLSDLGNETYLRHLAPDTVEGLYGDALGALIVLQAGIRTDSSFLPRYDDTLLYAELELFREWYLGRELGQKLSSGQNRLLDEVWTRLVALALEQPQVWVHRDYHSRNLMVVPANNPGILDFQDAVVGPVTYDLVSLLRDCYIRWPAEQVRSWAKGYYDLAAKSGIPVGESATQFLDWFDAMGVQRHLKAIGIFARLNHRDGKPGYLADIPRTLGYVVEVAREREDLEPLVAVLDELKVSTLAAV
jgi:aminoglycoside/choline kinase family phosphotransferase